MSLALNNWALFDNQSIKIQLKQYSDYKGWTPTNHQTGLLEYIKKKKKKIKKTVRLSLLTTTSLNCVKCFCLCVLRWLMRPILALNCLLQIEQERSEEESSVGDALALAFRWTFADSVCFVFTSTPSYEASPFCSILCNLFPDSVWWSP